jgi:hypothetical protein
LSKEPKKVGGSCMMYARETIQVWYAGGMRLGDRQQGTKLYLEEAWQRLQPTSY